jgi:hypothetical protein
LAKIKGASARRDRRRCMAALVLMIRQMRWEIEG